MVSFYLGLGFSLYYLNQTRFLQQILGGLVVRRGDCGPGIPGSNPAHVFSFKRETCTFTTFVEQKLSLWVEKVSVSEKGEGGLRYGNKHLPSKLLAQINKSVSC